MDPAEITPELLLSAYARGYFPMAASRGDPELRWFHPEQRGILPLDGFHIPRSLRKTLKRWPYRVTLNHDFAGVIHGCATTRDDTWINPQIEQLYLQLHQQGHAHSVECWQENTLIGGLYGVSLAGAFFGESMFSRAPDASKIALVHLVAWLREAGYRLLDTQYVNEHLLQFGVQEIPRQHYLARLKLALAVHPQPLVARPVHEIVIL